MSTNDVLYEKALRAITALYEDATVSKQETRVNMELLADLIENYLDTLPDEYEEE